MPLNIDIEINGQKYKLVHGAPEEDYFDSDMSYCSPTEYTVWQRIYPDTFKPRNYTLIFGHTPTRRYQNHNPLKIWFGDGAIGIDCGSGFPENDQFFPHKGRLACLRLNDMKEYYSD